MCPHVHFCVVVCPKSCPGSYSVCEVYGVFPFDHIIGNLNVCPITAMQIIFIYASYLTILSSFILTSDNAKTM